MRRLVLALGLVLIVVARAGALCTANASGNTEPCRNAGGQRPHYRIARDAYGVPHLKARSLYDVGYGIGVAQAQDRLFQMEFVRKSATGNVAEIVGRDFLASDQDTRRQFYSEEERAALYLTLSCDLQAVIQGYVDGVNAWVAQIYGDPTLAQVPHEFF